MNAAETGGGASTTAVSRVLVSLGLSGGAVSLVENASSTGAASLPPEPPPPVPPDPWATAASPVSTSRLALQAEAAAANNAAATDAKLKNFISHSSRDRRFESKPAGV